MKELKKQNIVSNLKYTNKNSIYIKPNYGK